MNVFSTIGISLGTVGATTPPSVAAGDYVKSAEDAPTLSVPTDPSWNTLTTLVSDNSANDHTTYEAFALGAVGTETTIEIMRAFSSSALRSTSTYSVFYGQHSDTCTLYYWDGAAWQIWDNTALPLQLEDWRDVSLNPTDRTTQYLLLVMNAQGDGTGTEIRVGDWRVT